MPFISICDENCRLRHQDCAQPQREENKTTYCRLCTDDVMYRRGTFHQIYAPNARTISQASAAASHRRSRDREGSHRARKKSAGGHRRAYNTTPRTCEKHEKQAKKILRESSASPHKPTGDCRENMPAFPILLATSRPRADLLRLGEARKWGTWRTNTERWYLLPLPLGISPRNTIFLELFRRKTERPLPFPCANSTDRLPPEPPYRSATVFLSEGAGTKLYASVRPRSGLLPPARSPRVTKNEERAPPNQKR